METKYSPSQSSRPAYPTTSGFAAPTIRETSARWPLSSPARQPRTEAPMEQKDDMHLCPHCKLPTPRRKKWCRECHHDTTRDMSECDCWDCSNRRNFAAFHGSADYNPDPSRS